VYTLDNQYSRYKQFEEFLFCNTFFSLIAENQLHFWLIAWDRKGTKGRMEGMARGKALPKKAKGTAFRSYSE
jgi:hypothetical protein